ncbi:MAG: BON domain-containing protein [Phycisphaerales bacterium]
MSHRNRNKQRGTRSGFDSLPGPTVAPTNPEHWSGASGGHAQSEQRAQGERGSYPTSREDEWGFQREDDWRGGHMSGQSERDFDRGSRGGYEGGPEGLGYEGNQRGAWQGGYGGNAGYGQGGYQSGYGQGAYGSSSQGGYGGGSSQGSAGQGWYGQREPYRQQGNFQGQGGGYGMGQGQYGQGSYGPGGYGQSEYETGYSGLGASRQGSWQGNDREQGSWGGGWSGQGGSDSGRASGSSSPYGYAGYSSGGSGRSDEYRSGNGAGRSAGSYAGGSGYSKRGKAPKSYQRSDDRIKEDVCEAMMDAGIDGSELDIAVASGVVTLSGSVNDRRNRYHLEHLASTVSGVKDVENNVRVSQDSTQATGIAAAAGRGASEGSSGKR